jgi:CheY-like chemotaxis protein
MAYTVLIADDDQGVRKSHLLALKQAALAMKTKIEAVEAENSVKTREKIHEQKFDLIILDNDFKDESVRGRLPGIAILQMARKNGPNISTPVIFCSGEIYETLRPMAERYQSVYISKTSYNLNDFSKLLQQKLSETDASKTK